MTRSAPPVPLRAFYLERSNLPTDASTTAVKIDQVRPRQSAALPGVNVSLHDVFASLAGAPLLNP